MSLEYVNRQGDSYFVLQGTTKTGKPKYYASRKKQGTLVDQMPDGFEFYENPERGVVTVRKRRETQIRPEERTFLEDQTRQLGGTEFFVVELQEGSLVIHTPSSVYSSSEVLKNLFEDMGVDTFQRESSWRRIPPISQCFASIYSIRIVGFSRSIAGAFAAALMTGSSWDRQDRSKSRPRHTCPISIRSRTTNSCSTIAQARP